MKRCIPLLLICLLLCGCTNPAREKRFNAFSQALAGQETLQAEGEKRGMVIDFGDLKKAVRALADSFDHALIYEAGSLKPATLAALQEENFRLIEVPYRPTAENFAKAFYAQLKAEGLPVLRVTVYETPDNCASYEV